MLFACVCVCVGAFFFVCGICTCNYSIISSHVRVLIVPAICLRSPHTLRTPADNQPQTPLSWVLNKTMQKVKEEDNIQAVVLAKMVKERRPDSDKQTAKAKTFKRVYRMANRKRRARSDNIRIRVRQCAGGVGHVTAVHSQRGWYEKILWAVVVKFDCVIYLLPQPLPPTSPVDNFTAHCSGEYIQILLFLYQYNTVISSAKGGQSIMTIIILNKCNANVYEKKEWSANCLLIKL